MPTIKGVITAKSIIPRNYCGLNEANHRMAKIFKNPADGAADESI